MLCCFNLVYKTKISRFIINEKQRRRTALLQLCQKIANMPKILCTPYIHWACSSMLAKAFIIAKQEYRRQTITIRNKWHLTSFFFSFSNLWRLCGGVCMCVFTYSHFLSFSVLYFFFCSHRRFHWGIYAYHKWQMY